MRKLILAAVLALFFSTNALAKATPESFGHMGFHFGMGPTGYWDTPPKFIVDEDDWGGLAADVGLVFKLNINETLNLLLELNLGFNGVFRDLSFVVIKQNESYKVEESRTIFKWNVPILFRFWPVDFVYVDAGVQLNYNLASAHTKDYKDNEGHTIRDAENRRESLEKWEVKGEVTSLVIGFGLGTLEADIGVRFILDLDRIRKHDEIRYYDDGSELIAYDDYVKSSSGKNLAKPIVAENKTKMWTIQFVINYFFI